MHKRLNQHGQFVPMTTMILFTVVLFLAAVLQIYKVSMAKLKVQNLADAVAMNLASQMAQAINVVTDRNEQLNHLYDDSVPKNKQLLPKLADVERHTFEGKVGAIGYANLVKTVNDAQEIFKDNYNTFIGDKTLANGAKSMSQILRDDIEDLSDPSLRVVTWNYQGAEDRARQTAERVQQDPSKVGSQIQGEMIGLKFKTHDIRTFFYEGKEPFKHPVPCRFSALLAGKTGKALDQTIPGQEVGWKELDTGQGAPLLHPKGTPRVRIAVGAHVVKQVDVFGVSVGVMATSIASVVPGSGAIPVAGQTGKLDFRPTYRVVLGI
jgi:hypothetical protein